MILRDRRLNVWARLALVVFAIAVWLVAFAVLRVTGSWRVFAYIGPALGALMLLLDRESYALLRPTPRSLGIGAAIGVAMTVATHVGYWALTRLIPASASATYALFGLLNVPGFSQAHRGALIILIATSEELIFRGPILGLAQDAAGYERPPWTTSLAYITAMAAVYALATIALQSALLVITAFCCGMIWGAARVWSRSLVTPITAHVLWNLGVLVIWQVIPID